ncbi:DUF1266 domain-containing protein [uncultured Gilvimarinus sp.]|uniref:DUF1266 domain-containing protein n=1 Tax=uncultured Gilvimarinus sp. TaxID=1689143 RepID=UPI0030ED653A
MLQNHPGEPRFPTSRELHPRAFNRLTQKQQTLFNGLITLAIITGGIAIVGAGVLSESLEPMPAGNMFVLAMAALALTCFAIITKLLWKAANLSVKDQVSYYAAGNVPAEYPEPYRQALQLDDVYAATLWTETLEYWPTEVRLEHANIKPQSFPLDDRQQPKESLDEHWGIVTKKDLLATTAALKSGMHCQGFLLDALGDHRPAVIERIASLTGIEESYIEGLSSNTATGQPPKLIWAWDLWRVIPLSRTGFMAGLISEQEAWEQILEVSCWIHAIFDSLEDYHKNLRVGHAYWANSYAATQERRETLQNFEDNTPFRPIRNLSWKRQSVDVLPTHIMTGLQSNESSPETLN